MAEADPLAHFTDREQQIAAFDRLWQQSTPWVLAFDGLAGNGKSTLIRWLIRHRCEREGIAYATVDLVHEAARTDFTRLLGHWEDSLASVVPAAAWHAYRDRRRAILAELNRQKVQITAVQKMDAAGSAAVTNTQQQMDISKLLREAERYARNCLTDEFLDLLCAAPGRVVLFLDTYEALQQADDPETIGWLWSGLLTRGHRRCPSLRVVVGSRETLGLAHELAALREPVEAFGPDDCDRFLRSWGIEDEALRVAIYALTQGHPLLTDMARELWQQGRQTGQPLSLGDIRQDLDSRAGTEWLYGRIIDRLAEPLKTAARYAPLLRRFNQESLNACLPEGAARLDDGAFRALIGRSFVERRGRFWACHDLVRGAQIAWLRRQHPADFERFHLQAAAFYDARWQARREREDFLEALYHRFWVDEEAAGRAWRDACDEAQLHGERAWLGELLALTENPELRDKPLAARTQAVIIERRASWHYYGGEQDLARQRYEAALPIYQAIGARLGAANCIRCLGDVHVRLAEYAEARQRYEAALPIYQAIGDRLGAANCIKSLGHVHVSLAEYAEARQRYAEALPIYQAIGDRLGAANCIRCLGDVHVMLAEYAEARQRYAEALPIYQAIGDRLGAANCIRCLGDVHYMLAEYAEARQRYAEALPIYQAIGARLGAANCIKSLGDVHVMLAESAEARQRYEVALPIYQAIGDRLGAANCIRCLGDVHLAEGDEAAALAAYEEAFERYLALGLPNDAAGALTSQTSIHERRHDYAAALPFYTRAIELAPGNPMWYRNRAGGYINLKDAARAAADIETAARLQPEHPYLHLHRGNLAILHGDYDAALAELVAFAAAYPNSNGSHFALARGHLLRRDAPAALAAIAQALALTYEAQHVRDAIYDLEEMRREHGDLPGLAEALARLRGWLEEKR